MKRDSELITEILLFAEEHCTTSAVYLNPNYFSEKYKDVDDNTLHLHIAMVVEDGFLDVKRKHLGYCVYGLTNEGHDYLDELRKNELHRKKEVRQWIKAHMNWLIGIVIASLISAAVAAYVARLFPRF